MSILSEQRKRFGVGAPSANGHANGVAAAAARPAQPLADAGISAAALMALDLPDPKFAVEGLLSEGLTLFGGRPKMGKSWLSLLIAWAVAGGHALDGRPVRGGAVLMLALEDTRRRLKGRIQMLAPALAWPVPGTLDLRTSWPRADQGGLYHLAEWLSDRKDDARLVVIDTLAKFRRPAKGQGNGYGDDYQALGEIKELVDRYGVSVMVNTHTRKLPAEDPFDELSGTLAQAGAADGLVVLERRRGEDRGKLFVTGRDVPETTVPLALDRDTWRWTLGAAVDGIDTAGRGAAGRDGNKVQQCGVWLREFLAKYAYPSKEIAAAAKRAGFSFSTLRDAKAALGRNGTDEVQSKNYGGDDWWSGLGPAKGWVLRPANSPNSPNSRSGGDDELPDEIPM